MNVLGREGIGIPMSTRRVVDRRQIEEAFGLTNSHVMVGSICERK